MGKRQLVGSNEYEPMKKKSTGSSKVEPGDVLYDISGRQWRLGQPVGEGAFGEIFMAADCTSGGIHTEQSPYVAKVELHSNGPLFVETHFYLKVAREDQINNWKQRNRKTIGLPHYIASGSHTKLSTRYRFLILPRYSIDLQQILDRHEHKFNIKTVLTIALQLLDTLEYVHSCGFVHADIKASNILINDKPVPSLPVGPSSDGPANMPLAQNTPVRRLRSRRTKKHALNLRSAKVDLDSNASNLPSTEQVLIKQNQNLDPNQVYLLDYGLASKYVHANGVHKSYCVDERKAHAGTILFCSLDAHHGVQSRRSDLESLGYNMIYWLTAVLPWINNVEDYDVVMKKKQICMQELDHFLHFCFGKDIPLFLRHYFIHIKALAFDEAPNYEYCRKVFIQGFNEYGYKKVFTLDFENKEGWGMKKKLVKNTENDRRRAAVVCSIIRTPLKSNLPAKHVLRKKDKDKAKMMRWSKILIDPELIIKSGKRVKEHDESDNSDPLGNLKIEELNPTETMLQVYQNYFERQNNCELSTDSKQSDELTVIEGYTPAMMAVYNKIIQRECEELVKKSPKRTKKPAKARKATPKVKRVKVAKVIAIPPARRYNTRSTKLKS